MNRSTLCIVFLLLSHLLIAQDVNDHVQIKNNNGDKVIGIVQSISKDEITIESTFGVVTINREDIENLQIVDNQQEVDSNGFPIDYHNSTHYLVNPSGFTLKKGQAYYENIGVFFNTYAYGVSDRFTIAVGGEIASPLFKSFPIFYVSPRYSIPFGAKSNSLSLGGTIFTIPFDGLEAFGVLQGAITLGSRNHNFTLGSGIGFSFSEGFEESVLPFYFSFMTRLSQKLSLVSDNFILSYNNFDGSYGILSLALRIHFSKVGTVFNAGLFRGTEDWGDVFALPFVSATIPIGK